MTLDPTWLTLRPRPTTYQHTSPRQLCRRLSTLFSLDRHSAWLRSTIDTPYRVTQDGISYRLDVMSMGLADLVVVRHGDTHHFSLNHAMIQSRPEVWPYLYAHVEASSRILAKTEQHTRFLSQMLGDFLPLDAGCATSDSILHVVGRFGRHLDTTEFANWDLGDRESASEAPIQAPGLDAAESDIEPPIQRSDVAFTFHPWAQKDVALTVVCDQEHDAASILQGMTADVPLRILGSFHLFSYLESDGTSCFAPLIKLLEMEIGQGNLGMVETR